MIDAEPPSFINRGSETTKSSDRDPEPANPSLSTKKIAVPVPKRTTSTKASDYPPESNAVLGAEKRRAAQITAHLAICTTEINSVEAALSPLSIDETKSTVDGVKVYLRAAIA
ncbi:hypothetical protein K3495_g5025 [Podosphaera aphanis]|nr:hypothetical protein K3495_g5025 [Podosphaera aphanis]